MREREKRERERLRERERRERGMEGEREERERERERERDRVREVEREKGTKAGKHTGTLQHKHAYIDGQTHSHAYTKTTGSMQFLACIFLGSLLGCFKT